MSDATEDTCPLSYAEAYREFSKETDRYELACSAIKSEHHQRLHTIKSRMKAFQETCKHENTEMKGVITKYKECTLCGATIDL